jgi:hypothetical protein
MTACVIMLNMIVEDERDDNIYDQGWDFEGELAGPAAGVASWEQFMHATEILHDRPCSTCLQSCLNNNRLFIWFM